MDTTTDARYIVIGTDVHDRQTGRIAKFQNAGVAQIGADWLNTPEATPEDYEWVSAPEVDAKRSEIAGSVRYWLAGEFGARPFNSTILRDILGTTAGRARDLWNGRKAFTDDELTRVAIAIGEDVEALTDKEAYLTLNGAMSVTDASVLHDVLQRAAAVHGWQLEHRALFEALRGAVRTGSAAA